jgi:hypothetical protein
MRGYLLFPFIGLLILPLVAVAQVYTWQDADGRHYSDTPPAGTKLQVHTISAEGSRGEDHAGAAGSGRGGCRTMFDASRAVVVDENVGYGNLLVRGNFPLDCDRSFAFNDLDKRLKELKGSGFDLNEYEIAVITLINNAGDKNDLKAEEAVFGLGDVNCQDDYSDGTPGLYTCLDGFRTKPYVSSNPVAAPQEFYWWPLWICANGDYKCASPDTYSYSKLQDLPSHMNNLLNAAPPYTGGKSKRLVYFHCEHGCDRTGTVHAAYQMFKGKISLQDAVNKANQAIGQTDNCMKGGYLALARRYCKYMYGDADPACQ